MIDFPASPVDGQIFSATNGVVYKWSATYSSWLAQNPTPPLGGTGDFCALQTSAFPTLTTSYATLILTQIYSGNSGLWYNTANGRYTPPAGRYFIDAGVCITVASSSSPGIVLRKNGTVLIEDQGGGSGASTRATAKVFLIVDANGSDWFDIQGLNSGGAPLFVFNMTFQAFPLTGMQGPTGGAPGPVVGDFCATNSATINLTGAQALVAGINTVLNGNSGSYYNTTTNRYTPPAGRYRISFSTAPFNSGGQTGSAIFTIRKNGTVINQQNATTVSQRACSGIAVACTK